jgi:hypothetical protein
MDAVVAGRDSVVVCHWRRQVAVLPGPVVAGLVSPWWCRPLVEKDQWTLQGNGGLPGSSTARWPPIGSRRAAACRRDITGCSTCRLNAWSAQVARLPGPARHATGFVAIDEAHHQPVGPRLPAQRSPWPARERLPGISLHAFTATATAQVRRINQSACGTRWSSCWFDRPNLVYRVLARATPAAAAGRAGTAPSEAGVIYCTSRRRWTRWPSCRRPASPAVSRRCRTRSARHQDAPASA